MLPPFTWSEAAFNWQFAPIVTGFTVVLAAAYLWGAFRVRRRHPRRPWPVGRTAAFMLGLLSVNIATQSGIGTYDDTLFWDHMTQHLLLLMVAPPLLVSGMPVTLLLHASRNPAHAWVIKIIRSKPVVWITWPAVGIVAYGAVIVGTHLTNFMNLVTQYDAVHQAEHVLYLAVGYLYFLPLVGKEPIKWKMSYPLRLFLLFLAMPVDAFTGVVLGSYQTYPFLPMAPRNWGPTPLNDLHQGGAVMWIGGAAIMFAVIMVTFFSWSREPRSSASMGWFETARRATIADRISEGAPPTAAATVRGAESGAGQGGRRPADVDESDDQLAAYNAYLARLNKPVSQGSEPSE
jgi:cytochrome c oxidase assembly factor CtaG